MRLREETSFAKNLSQANPCCSSIDHTRNVIEKETPLDYHFNQLARLWLDRTDSSTGDNHYIRIWINRKYSFHHWFNCVRDLPAVFFFFLSFGCLCLIRFEEIFCSKPSSIEFKEYVPSEKKPLNYNGYHFTWKSVMWLDSHFFFLYLWRIYFHLSICWTRKNGSWYEFIENNFWNNHEEKSFNIKSLQSLTIITTHVFWILANEKRNHEEWWKCSR